MSVVLSAQAPLHYAIQGDARITGDLFVDDITFDDANMQDLTVTDTLTVAGITTLASSGGITTTGGQLYHSRVTSVLLVLSLLHHLLVMVLVLVKLVSHLKAPLLEQVQQSLTLKQQPELTSTHVIYLLVLHQ